MPAVTVVITNYNHGHFLRRAVESALEQTRRPDRILVIDDGSTDASSTVLDGLPSPVEVLRQENRGVVAARNRAIGTVDTSHIAFLDADNWLLPMFLRWHLGAWALPHGRRLALTYSPARNIDPAGQVGHLHSGPWNPRRLAQQNYIDNTAVYLRAALEDVGGYSEAFADLGHEDWDLMLKLADRGWHGRMVPRPTFVYRTADTGRNAASLRHREALEAAIRRAHPAPPPTGRFIPLTGKLTNPIQTAFRRWDLGRGGPA